MSQFDRFVRWLVVALVVTVVLLCHLLADTRERLLRMEDETRVLVTDCRERGACHYPMGAP